jgi:hypothetical protein
MTKNNRDQLVDKVVARIAADRREFLRKLLLGSAAAAALPLLSPDLLAQGSAPAAEITAINETTGIVIAKVKSTGQLFQFTPNNKAQLGQLKIGQPVFANFTSRQISFDGKSPAGTILSIPTADKGSAGTSAASKGVPTDVKGASPIDGIITNINANPGVITAKVNSTGEFFTFTLTNSSQLKTLKVGQRVFANFSNKHVSFDGKTAAGTVTSGPNRRPNSGTNPGDHHDSYDIKGDAKQ